VSCERIVWAPTREQLYTQFRQSFAYDAITVVCSYEGAAIDGGIFPGRFQLRHIRSAIKTTMVSD
jgi:hypothetical protein